MDTDTYNDVKKTINANTLQTKNTCQKRKSRKLYYLKYGKPQNKNVAAASKEKKQQIAPQKEKEEKSYAGAVKRPQQMASNQSRPMSFVDHLKNVRASTSQSQRDRATKVPGMIKILQRPKQRTEKSNQTTHVEAQTTEEIQNRNQKNETTASMYHGGLTDMLTALNETTKAITGTINDPFGQVINLSNFKFSLSEFKLLNKNLNFCPTPLPYKTKKLEEDMKEFFRKIKLKAHFNNAEETLEDEEETDEQQADEERIFRKKSRWTPYNVHHTVEIFIEAVKSDIYSTPKVPLPKNNLSKKEIKAMNDLKQRTDIIITKADKGGAVVIIAVKDYIKEANR
eukprot:gene471-10148_t